MIHAARINECGFNEVRKRPHTCVELEMRKLKYILLSYQKLISFADPERHSFIDDYFKDQPIDTAAVV